LPIGEETEILAFSKSLYLDVRPTEILSSNVSFRQIKRLELMRELEERVLTDMRAELENADKRTMSAAIASIESSDPELLIRKIEQLKNSDPEVARKIMELNRIDADATVESDSQGFIESAELNYNQSRKQIFYGQPTTVQEVPVPEELK
jgi:hypothetical protein